MAARERILAKLTRVALLLGLMAAATRGDEFWDYSVVESSGTDAGWAPRGTDIAILQSGHPAVAYYPAGTAGLKYAWYDGETWHASIVDEEWRTGVPSLAILPSGYPAVSFLDSTNGNVMYAMYNGSSWGKTVVDSVGTVGVDSGASLAILPSGDPAISYIDVRSGPLKYARYEDGTWQTTIVDAELYAWWTSSLAILPSGDPAISYISDRDLKYTWYDGSTWNTSVVVDTVEGWCSSSLAILPSGQPAIAFRDAGYSLNYTWHDGQSWQTSVVDSDVGYGPSLGIMPSGQPAISYYHGVGQNVMYAWFEGGAWNTSVVDCAGKTGRYSSLAILPSGDPIIGYFDTSTGSMKVARRMEVAAAPVPMSASYTSTAWTRRHGDTVVLNGPAYDRACFGGPEQPACQESYVQLHTTGSGHLRGLIGLAGNDGGYPWEACSCGDAAGILSGTLEIDLSPSYPLNSRLALSVELIVGGDPGDFELYQLRLWRYTEVIAYIGSSGSCSVTQTVYAGESLTFELFALEEDWFGDSQGYDRGFEMRLILAPEGPIPGDYNDDGEIDLADFANWGDCMAGPEGGLSASGCEVFDFDRDNDVDLADAGAFQNACGG